MRHGLADVTLKLRGIELDVSTRVCSEAPTICWKGGTNLRGQLQAAQAGHPVCVARRLLLGIYSCRCLFKGNLAARHYPQLLSGRCF